MKEGGDGPGRNSARGNAAEALERKRDGALFINLQENDEGLLIPMNNLSTIS
jgi:hypothetical protein